MATCKISHFASENAYKLGVHMLFAVQEWISNRVFKNIYLFHLFVRNNTASLQ